MGFTEGIFPSSKTIEERKELGLEEERRLCYVAITRAEKHLFLMDSEGTSPKGIKKLCSRFLDEIGTNNYKRIGSISDELLQESKNYIAKLNREMKIGTMATVNRDIGDAVEHHIFGPGIITDINDKRGCYIVKFNSLTQPRSITKTYFDEKHENAAYPALPKTEREPTEIIKADKPAANPCLIPNTPNLPLPGNEFDDENKTEMPIVKTALSENDADDGGNEQCPDTETDAATGKAVVKAKERAKNSPNLWNRDDIPHHGWHCVGVEDLKAPVGICEMCGNQVIRYAHHMEHPLYGSLICGCVCAGKMEDDIEAAKQRENELKKRQARRVNFFKRKWKHSQKGNDYLKIDDHIIVIYKLKNNQGWKYSVDNQFSKDTYASRERAMAAAFDRLADITEGK